MYLCARSVDFSSFYDFGIIWTVWSFLLFIVLHIIEISILNNLIIIQTKIHFPRAQEKSEPIFTILVKPLGVLVPKTFKLFSQYFWF